MLTEVCLYCKNWFVTAQFLGMFTIENGVIISRSDGDMGIQDGQYFRIVGSVFNDGVYKKGEEELVDESFDGAVWLMAVPKSFLDLVSRIGAWVEANCKADSANMSPFNSESFGGYSYSKSSGGSDSTSTVSTWQGVFSDDLRRYRKL